MMIGIVSVTAIIAAAVASMVIGMVWFSPGMCGKAMMKACGMDEAAAAKAKAEGMGMTYVWAFITMLVTAYVLGYFIAALGVSGWQGGATVGAWAWLGFFATAGVSRVLSEKKSANFFWMSAGYDLVSLVVMGAILASW